MSTISIDQVEKTIDITCDTVIANEKYFSDLDGLAGDGDFGTSLATGFKVIKNELPEIDKSAIGAMLLKISMICSKHVGGSSGPIWGTGFMRAGMVAKGLEELSYQNLVDMLGFAIEGIAARGGAQRGDKTLLDALWPIHDKMREMNGPARSVSEAPTRPIRASSGSRPYSTTGARPAASTTRPLPPNSIARKTLGESKQ